MSPTRCPWSRNPPFPDYETYHDREWGVPLHDDHRLFELLTLEGAQAGLSWATILRKRDHYRRVFAGFDPVRVARITPARVERILEDPGIVRNRLKVESTIANARAVIRVQREFGTLDQYLWRFVDGRQKQNAWPSMKDVPVRTSESDQMARDLKHRGFRFVGTTVCYAFMQAAGLVNDHTVDCFRHRQIART